MLKMKGTLIIKSEMTEQQIIEDSLMKYHSGYDYKITLLFYALAKSWNINKLNYYLGLIEEQKQK